MNQLLQLVAPWKKRMWNYLFIFYILFSISYSRARAERGHGPAAAAGGAVEEARPHRVGGQVLDKIYVYVYIYGFMFIFYIHMNPPRLRTGA
jgi:hypothetical protein